MKATTTLLIATVFASTLLSACGSALPGGMAQVAGTRQLQAQAATGARAVSNDMQAQYFSVLLDIKYTPDTDGHHFGYDWITVSFADSHAKHIELNLAFNPQTKLFTLNLVRSSIGAQPANEHVSMDNTARRAELAEELRRLNGSPEDDANLARAIAVIAPSAR